MTKFTILPWDSEFFGFKTGKIEVSEYDPSEIQRTVESAFTEGAQLIYLIIPDVLDRKEIFCDRLIDQKVIFSKSIRVIADDIPGIAVYDEESVSADLYEIALESGKYSRFKTDEKLPAGSYEKLYRKWIERSVNGELADKVFVYRENFSILGMITVKIKPGRGEIGLLGIHPGAQGKGIGSKLISAAENFVLSKNLSEMEVATQYGNSQACRFYEKNGYSVRIIFNYYHIHKF